MNYIFLLTDGAVYGETELLKLIQKNADDSRVFSVGIGNCCSQGFIKECARIGCGEFEFVKENKEISEKVVHLLSQSMKLFYNEFEFKYSDKTKLGLICPHPDEIRVITQGKFATFFIFFQESAFDENGQIKLQLHYMMGKSNLRNACMDEIIIQKDDCLNDAHPLSNVITKFGIYKCI